MSYLNLYQFEPVKTNLYQLVLIYTAGWSLSILAGRNINPGTS